MTDKLIGRLNSPRTYRIASIPGDGIGPEVIREALRVLEAAQDGFRLEVVAYPFGADHFLKTGELVPDSAFREIASMEAGLLGAIGDPRVETGKLEFGIVGRLRFDLDLYVNLRPIRCYADWLCPLKDKRASDLDILVIRENTEDAYRGRTIREGDRAVQEMTYTRQGTERITRFAFERARERKKRLTLVDKANAVRAHALHREVFEEVGREYPDVERDSAFVDAFCMWMIKNPEKFDTVVTTNMFGDIVTDLGAALQGGWGSRRGETSIRGRCRCSSRFTGRRRSTRGRTRPTRWRRSWRGG